MFLRFLFVLVGLTCLIGVLVADPTAPSPSPASDAVPSSSVDSNQSMDTNPTAAPTMSPSNPPMTTPPVTLTSPTTGEFTTTPQLLPPTMAPSSNPSQLPGTDVVQVKKNLPPKESPFKIFTQCLSDKDADIQAKCAGVLLGDSMAKEDCLDKAILDVCGKPVVEEVTLKAYNKCYRDNEVRFKKICAGKDLDARALCYDRESRLWCGQPTDLLAVTK